MSRIKVNPLNIFLVLLICLFFSALNLIRTPAWSFDVVEYQIIYEQIAELSSWSATDFISLSFEPSFFYLAILANTFTPNVNLVLFIFSFVSLYIKFIYIPNLYVKHTLLFIILYLLTYYYLFELTQNRIAIASAFILVGYHFLVTNRRLLFIASVLFAASFHYSAIIALIALIFDSRNDKNTIIKHVVIFACLIGFSILMKSPAFLAVIELLDAKKGSYLVAADADLGTGFLRVFFVVSYQVLILIICKPSILIFATNSVSRFHKLLFNLYAVSIFLYLTLHSFGVVAVRLAEVFRNVEPFLLVITLAGYPKRNRQSINAMILVSIIVNLQKNSNIIYPLYLLR